MSVTCPKCGQLSATVDYCDQCGALLAGEKTGASPLAAPTSSIVCPQCGTPAESGAGFCEDCGCDFATGELPPQRPAQVAPAGGGDQPVGAATAWDVELAVDPDGWAEHADLRNDPSVPPPPAVVMPLVTSQVSIGRASRSRGTVPDIDAAALLLDPAISHLHCTLSRDAAGRWAVADEGSSNGTIANGRAVTGAVALADGSVIEIGAWTAVTLRAHT